MSEEKTIQEETVSVPVLAVVVANPDTNQIGITYGPAVNDKVAFLISLAQLVSQEQARAYKQSKTSQIQIAKAMPMIQRRGG